MAELKKLHIGCGTVYLEGWTNVDMATTGVHLASDRPDLVALFRTTEDKYYARHEDKNIEKFREEGPLKEEYVCDAYGSFERLPASISEIGEILSRQCFEHLSLTEARKALDEVDRVMAPGSILRIDVPDHEAAMDKYRETGNKFYVRHVLGPRKSDHGYHMMGYNKKQLTDLVEEFGFLFEKEEENIHCYPAFCLRFRKPFVQAARDYALEGVVFDQNWRVGDLGPGKNPLERADCYIDIDKENIDRLSTKWPSKQYVNCNIENGTPLDGKYFDYLFAAHVVEHCIDPLNALKEITRIAKRGCVVLPHAFKEYLFLYEESDHKWLAFNPHRKGDPIGFMRMDQVMKEKIIDRNVQSALCRLYRTGPNRLDSDSRLLRKWFQKVEKNLDVVVHWEGSVEGVYIW